MNTQPSSHRKATVIPFARSSKLALAGIAALALAFGGALPALATDDPAQEEGSHVTAPVLTSESEKLLEPVAGGQPSVLGLPDDAPVGAPLGAPENAPGGAPGGTSEDEAPGSMTATLTAEALATEIEAGESFRLTVTVAPAMLGAPEPTGTVSLVSGGLIVDSEPLEGGQAIVLVRPLVADVYNLNIVYSGDENYASATSAAPSFEVTAAPVTIDMFFDTAPVIYGGDVATIYVILGSECASNADPESREFCDAIYGLPSGALSLTVTNPDTGEVVHTESHPVAGTPEQGTWADPFADFTVTDPEELFVLNVPVPDILLGSPAAWDFRASFTSSSWFADAATMLRTAEVVAASTSVDLFVGDDMLNPINRVTGPVQLTALVSSDQHSSAPLEGTFNFFADGKLIAAEVPLEDGVGAKIMWEPAVNGSVSLTAEFVPTTFNHSGSMSAESIVEVVLTQPDKKDAAKPAVDKQLAKTGASDTAAVLGVTSLALMLVGAVVLGARRLKRQ